MPELGSECHSRAVKSQIAYTDLVLSCLQPPYTKPHQADLQVRMYTNYAITVSCTFQQAAFSVLELRDYMSAM